MRLKSYFADSVQEAIDQARVELGAEAMLVSSRPDQDLNQLGRYEVVFGLGAAEVAASAQRRDTTPSTANDTVLRELAELRRQMEGFRDSVARSSVTRATEQLTPDMARIFHRLSNAGFSPELSQELTEAVAQRARPHTERTHRMIRDQRDLFARDLVDAMLDEEIASRFEVDATLGVEPETSSRVMLVGPPAAGKTSSLVKLGLRFALKAKRGLRIFSLDTLRIGGWDQLNRYARISAVDFKPLQDSSALEAALKGQPGKDLTLIDTPGFSKVDEREMEELARCARDLPIEVQLVLPAHLSLDVAERTWKRFAVFQPAKLILTHLDAVENSAAAIEIALRSGLPLSFLSAGQQVPEDIRQAVKSELTAGLFANGHALSMTA